MEMAGLIESVLGQNGPPGNASQVTLMKNTAESTSFSWVASIFPLVLVSTLQYIHPQICASGKSQDAIWHIKDLANKSS